MPPKSKYTRPSLGKKRKEVIQEAPIEHPEIEQPVPNRKAKKRVPLGEIIRENQLKYNKFIPKQVPKLLKSLGVSSASDSDS